MSDPADLHPVIVHLTHLRKAAGLSQAEVAKRAGVIFQQISLWERGANNPNLGNLTRWAAAFNLTITTTDGGDPC